MALKTQVDALKERLTDGRRTRSRPSKTAAMSNACELKAATQELTEERGKVENLGRRVSELEQQLVAQTTEAEILGRRAMDLENRLTDQSKVLTQNETRAAPPARPKSKPRARPKPICAPPSPNSTAAPTPRPKHSDRAVAAAGRTRRKPTKSAAALARELAAHKRETEESWASERVENALLRERINDVAAEVARLASALEGPNSPIDAILATEMAQGRGGQRQRHGTRRGGVRRGRPGQAATSPTASARCKATPRACRTSDKLTRNLDAAPALRVARSLDTSSPRSLYRPAVTAGRLAQRESVPFTRERS